MNQVLRQEHKFLMTAQEAMRLNWRLSCIMKGDIHNGADGYPVRSLYFDTPDNKDLSEKIDGVCLRKKLRLRVYRSEALYANLEMKQKQGQCQRKRSLRISRADACRVIRGDFSVLLTYEEPFAAECYAALSCGCYRPKTIVEYRRTAYVADTGDTRITFDKRITASESCTDFFAKKPALLPIYDPYFVVLEVKYRGFLLGYIGEVLNSVNRSPLSASKYCMGRNAGLGHYD